MTNKNGTVVPAPQELETFLPVDTINGVTKWVYAYYVYFFSEFHFQQQNDKKNKNECISLK